ncbi:Late embryogenesis abundant protein, LEA_2 subgroup [Dillenia turbinata]|uniref:Late embryogenesis abundant protein, LEA_2 subgroup n=1 Tax=Dillenia turbinata TaxID=194707 RepID=A0AAN8UQV5_9MAGN
MSEPKSFGMWLLQFVALLLLLLALLLWLLMRPKPPHYTIVELFIPALNNTNATSLAGLGDQNETISFVLEIKNPNEVSSIYYDDTFLTFYYGEDIAGEKTIPSFHLGKKKKRKVTDAVNVNAGAWKVILNSIMSNSNAELKACLVSHFRLGKRSKHHGISLQAVFKIGSDGKLSGKNQRIKLHKYSRKWNRKVRRHC